MNIVSTLVYLCLACSGICLLFGMMGAGGVILNVLFKEIVQNLNKRASIRNKKRTQLRRKMMDNEREAFINALRYETGLQKIYPSEE